MSARRAPMTYDLTDDHGSVCAPYGHVMLQLAERGPSSTADLAESLTTRKTPYGTNFPWKPKAHGWTTSTTASLLNQVRHHGYPVEFDGKLWTLHEPMDLRVAVAMLAAFQAAHFDSLTGGALISAITASNCEHRSHGSHGGTSQNPCKCQLVGAS